jgi:hypothetical protein
MSEPEISLCRKYSRAEQKLRDLMRKNKQVRELADQVTGTSEDTAQLFSSGTTPLMKITMDSRSAD